jgi:hypothetical protein
MSEHSPHPFRPPAFVPPAEKDENGCPTVEAFLQKVLSELWPEAVDNHDRLTGKRKLTTEELLKIQADTWEGFVLIYGGMEPD